MTPSNPPHDALRAAVARGVAEHGAVVEMTAKDWVAKRTAELVDYHREHGEWPDLTYTYSIDEYAARTHAWKIVHEKEAK